MNKLSLLLIPCIGLLVSGCGSPSGEVVYQDYGPGPDPRAGYYWNGSVYVEGSNPYYHHDHYSQTDVNDVNVNRTEINDRTVNNTNVNNESVNNRTVDRKNVEKTKINRATASEKTRKNKKPDDRPTQNQ